MTELPRQSNGPTTVIGMSLMAAGAQRLRPGLYMLNGQAHIDAEEMLLAEGIAPTPATIAVLEAGAEQIAAEIGITSETVEWRAGRG